MRVSALGARAQAIRRVTSKELRDETQKKVDRMSQHVDVGGAGIISGAIKGAVTELVSGASSKPLTAAAIEGAKGLGLLYGGITDALGGIVGALAGGAAGGVIGAVIGSTLIGGVSFVKGAVKGAIDGLVIGGLTSVIASIPAVATLGLPGVVIGAGAGIIYNVGKYALKRLSER